MLNLPKIEGDNRQIKAKKLEEFSVTTNDIFEVEPIALSRSGRVIALLPGNQTIFPAKEERRIRSLISGYIKKKYPKRTFQTSVLGNALIVKRSATDLIEE